MKFASMKLLATGVGVALLVAACGGSGGQSQGSDGAAFGQISGTAATGAALANAPVTVTNSAGASPCQEATITTSALGSYTCTLKAGETAPFFVVVTDPTGSSGALVSIATSTPAAGSALTVNATPLTTAIVAQLAADGNALSVVSSGAVNAAALQAVTTNVLAQLAPLLARIGVPAGYDPFSTSITAATAGNTGNTADMVLDVVKVVSDPATGKLALSTIDNPTPVVLATATTAGAVVSAPDASVTTLSQATQLVAQKMTSCFALPTASRVLATNTAVPQSQGGPQVDAVGAACEDFVADTGNAGGIDFLHDGYNAGQFFYGLLTSDSMTGATFSVPEVLAFYPKSSSATAPAPEAYDRAIVNIRFIDAANNPGSVITVAARIPGSESAARPTDWWLVGNQLGVDVSIRTNLRRIEQVNPANSAKFSTFQTGMVFNINAKGPGSVLATNNLTLARVSGPGLPGNGAPGTGLVYKAPVPGNQASMDLFNKTGNLGAGARCGNGSSNCPSLWLARTAGITGAAATTPAANPASLVWAQTADAIDAAQFRKGARYKVELFYGTNVGTANVVLYKTLLTDLVPAINAAGMPWNTPGAQTLAALDPAGGLAGAQAALPVDWVQNPAAPQVGGVSVSIDTSPGVFGSNMAVPRGATSAQYNANVPAFAAPSDVRAILLAYRSGDTSNRSAVYTYN
jgi:hypothetical protein